MFKQHSSDFIPLYLCDSWIWKNNRKREKRGDSGEPLTSTCEWEKAHVARGRAKSAWQHQLIRIHVPAEDRGNKLVRCAVSRHLKHSHHSYTMKQCLKSINCGVNFNVIWWRRQIPPWDPMFTRFVKMLRKISSISRQAMFLSLPGNRNVTFFNKFSKYFQPRYATLNA